MPGGTIMPANYSHILDKNPNMERINGIFKDGIFCEAVKSDPSCYGCFFLMTEGCELGSTVCSAFKTGAENNIIFRYSRELTDKLNKK